MWSGFVGAFVGLCCAGIPLALAALSGIGLGFLINDFILLPLLFISLGLMFYSLNINRKKYLDSRPLYLAVFSSLVILVGIFLKPLIWFGVVGLLSAGIWDYMLIKKNGRRN